MPLVVEHGVVDKEQLLRSRIAIQLQLLLCHSLIVRNNRSIRSTYGQYPVPLEHEVI